jgi:hypothetical protein
MAFIDGDNGTRRWVSDRGRTLEIRDPLRSAAERFAENVETYLYDHDSDMWMKPEFLAWAIAQYDASKTSSGTYVNMNPEFDHAAAVQQPVPPQGPGPGHPSRNPDIALRYPEHAREATHIDTEKK